MNNKLFDFIEKAPTAYHAVNTIKEELIFHGYAELFEEDVWTLEDDGKYFVIRNGTSIIAFNFNKAKRGFMIAASHSDSPSFRVKATAELDGAYTRLEVEKYGGMIYYSWLDRPLSIAGRVVLRTDFGIESRLVNIERDFAVIPSVAIHMNRGINDGYKFNPASDMLPLVSMGGGCGITLSEIARLSGINAADIISHDLFLYNRERGRVFGADNEFILAPRLDDLECVFASLEGFLNSEKTDSIPVLAVFDNEEVGSETKQGAASTFLNDVLTRMASSDEKCKQMFANSFMISADNAHAKHPNHPELSDADNAPILNGGVVIKWNANQKYATDGISDAVFKMIASRADAKLQTYYNRADLPGGSTLGSISNTKVSIPTVDIGLPQLAMHSASESAGAADLSELVKIFSQFFKTSICREKTNVKF